MVEALREPDQPAKLDWQAAFTLAYEWGAYDARINYRKPPEPSLTDEHAAWAEERLAESGLSG